MERRVVKFRAWTGKEMIDPTEMSADQLTLDVNGRGFINVNSASTRLSEFYTHMVPLQFTGLKDKNGVEIYEGDIGWDAHSEYRGKVVFDEGGYRYVWDGVSGSLYECAHAIEIVDNIYENPKLLSSEGKS